MVFSVGILDGDRVGLFVGAFEGFEEEFTTSAFRTFIPRFKLVPNNLSRFSTDSSSFSIRTPLSLSSTFFFKFVINKMIPTTRSNNPSMPFIRQPRFLLLSTHTHRPSIL